MDNTPRSKISRSKAPDLKPILSVMPMRKKLRQELESKVV